MGDQDRCAAGGRGGIVVAFPSPSLPAPALAAYQLSYRGLTFGGFIEHTPYQLVSLPAGLDSPIIANGDVQRELDQGQFIGLDVYEGREITIEQVVQSDEESLDHARQALAGVLAVAGTTESPLYMQLPSGLFACMARPRKHNFKLDLNMFQAGGGIATSLLKATDPRWYAAPSKTATAELPGSGGSSGMRFPLTFPLTFGGGTGTGLLQVYNNGTFETRPVLIVTGPCTNPVISNLSLPGAPSVGFTIALNEGDLLEIDMDWQTVVYTPNGSAFGSSRRTTAMTTNTWWNLPPGLNQISFATGDSSHVTGTLTVHSADAYAGL